MEQIIVKDIPDSKLEFFLELVRNLGFKTEIKQDSNKPSKQEQQFVDETKSALEEVEEHLEGKKKLKTLNQLINEL